MDSNRLKAIQAKRLKREEDLARSSTNPYIWFRPTSEDKLTWHFTVRGPSNSPYENGIYHGYIQLPKNFPFSAPDFYFLTENGHFRVNSKICLNISGYHNEAWQAATTIEAMVQMIQAFMEDRQQNGISFIKCTDDKIRELAKQSVSYVCPTCGKIVDHCLPVSN